MEYDTYNIDSDNFNDDSVSGISVLGVSDENGSADTSAAVSADDTDSENELTDDYIDAQSDIDYTDILTTLSESVDNLNTEINTLSDNIDTYFTKNNDLITCIFIILVGYITISVFRRVFDAFH